jgi:hypothetical protein
MSGARQLRLNIQKPVLDEAVVGQSLEIGFGPYFPGRGLGRVHADIIKP